MKPGSQPKPLNNIDPNTTTLNQWYEEYANQRGTDVSKPRDEIKKIQTPQGFKKNILESFSNKESYGYDDISTALHYNNHISVKFFKGEIKNFKITSNIDMHLFKGIVDEM